MRRLTSFASVAGPLANAGRRVRAEIRRRYPDPEEAVAAVRDAMKDPKAVEEWASIVVAKTEYLQAADGVYEVERPGRPFTFDELPPAMRAEALEVLAAAMVAWTSEQERMYA